MQNSGGTRINKYLSELGLCSRREADRWIEQGRVTVNGKQPTAGTRIGSRDKLRVDGRVIESPQDDHIYLLFNKPPGIVTTTEQTEPDNIISYINYPRRIFPVGRLDKASEGLIILTSDGDIVNKILRAGNRHEKEYDVTVNQPVTDDFISKMSTGVPILGQVTKKCKVERTGPSSFRIVLIQGLNRQIRRMCEYFGYEVEKLKRTRIMHLKLDLPPGQFRDLEADELKRLFESIKDSDGTQQKKQGKQPKSSPQGKSKGKPQKTGGKQPSDPRNQRSGKRNRPPSGGRSRKRR